MNIDIYTALVGEGTDEDCVIFVVEVHSILSDV